jgi:hypothetical protein
VDLFSSHLFLEINHRLNLTTTGRAKIARHPRRRVTIAQAVHSIAMQTMIFELAY